MTFDIITTCLIGYTCEFSTQCNCIIRGRNSINTYQKVFPLSSIVLLKCSCSIDRSGTARSYYVPTIAIGMKGLYSETRKHKSQGLLVLQRRTIHLPNTLEGFRVGVEDVEGTHLRFFGTEGGQ